MSLEKINPFLMKSVNKATYQKYLSQWKVWQNFSSGKVKDSFLAKMNQEEKIEFILSFLKFLYDTGKRGRQASSILIGIKQIFIFHQHTPDMFDHPIIKQGIKALRYSTEEAKVQIESLNSNKELPFTIDLLEQLRSLNWGELWDRESLDRKAIYLAAAICLDSGRRIGHVTLRDGNYKNDHYIRAKQVTLFTNHLN